MAPIVIACGDHAGIGPEVALKAVAAERLHDSSPGFVLVGDGQELTRLRTRFAFGMPWVPYRDPESPSNPARPLSLPSHDTPVERPVEYLDLGNGADNEGNSESPESPNAGSGTARASLRYLTRAAQGCVRGEFAALVTAPVSKESILRCGVPFVGQTEFLADLSHTPEVTMMLLGDDDRGRWLRVALVTTHLPLREVASSIRASEVARAIRHAADACRRLGLARARIGVAGLTPHAGDGGMLGDEEILTIQPAVAAARESGIDATGPIPGDTLFHQAFRGDYDAVVAMYHDQGLAPLKLVAFDRGVNWTLGLPFIRTSPDHGTAFDIAGKGIADPASMRAALRMAAVLAGGAPA
ncbi:MAG: 4-hydroxythreonine-4-phosphate dehydrogenase PdxA [Limisphaerales bacterium]